MKKELNNILNHIEENLQSNLKLTDIAKEYHYSLSYLSRQFNRYVGMSFNTYINRRRLSLIASEIRNNDKSISYLSDIYCYPNQKYLSTKFKDMFRITPSTYKKGHNFIVLQPKRDIKGDVKTMINDLKELCFHIWKHSNNENELLDTIHQIENAIIYKKENAFLHLIVYFDEGAYTNIYEVELNLINGSYQKKSIFYVENKLHTLLHIDKDEEQYYVLFEDKKSKKQLRAFFEMGHQPYVVFQTNTVNGYQLTPESEDVFDMNRAFKEIDELKKRLLEQTNELEIREVCDKDDSLVLMRYFGSEFVLVKLVRQGTSFMMVSIYLDMLKKAAMSYHFFGTKTTTENIKIKQQGMELKTFVDDQLFATSYILGGSDKISAIFLKFPSGMSGSGGWDFSPEFK